MNNQQASQAYRDAYNAGKPLLDDFAYDAMFENNDLAFDDIGQGDEVKHMHFMGSLPTFFLDVNNVTKTELAIAGVLESNTEFIDISFKLDGVPGSCILGPDGWVRSVSRGKRYSGFMMNKAFLKVLPKPLNYPTSEIDIRGEFVISYKDFEELNAQMSPEDRYANPRSMVSAQINAKQPDQNVMERMKWFAHGIWEGNMSNEHFTALKNYIPEDCLAPNYNFDKDLFFKDSDELIAVIYDQAMQYEYPCDGIVIQYRATDENNGKCNLDRIAIKQFDESKFSGVTKVARIEWRLANNGSYFPRLHFAPIEINGADVTHAAGYCWDYVQRLGLSVGAEVVVTMRGGVIPYVSKVLSIGNGDYMLPKDAAEPQEGEMQLWSTNSEDAVQRLRFVRGMTMLDLKDCGVSLFSDMYDLKFKTLFDVASSIERDTFYNEMLEILPNTEATMAKINEIIGRFTTFNYVWLILALREEGIGFKAANVIGQLLSGYTLIDERPLHGKFIAAFLADDELISLVKHYSKPVAIEHADLSKERAEREPISGPVRKKAIMSKKPSNGMKKAEFASTYLADYDITENIKEADLLVCPAGETSNKIKYAQANNIEIKSYESFIA